MATRSTRKGKVKKSLLRGVYYNVPSPWGTVKANVEVWLACQVWLDPQGDAEHWPDEVGGDDLRGVIVQELDKIAERIAQLVESASPTSASLEKVAQAELFEGLEG